tara:strand:+ start:65 stop:946 length:882 start_codon:yes stop_codon:yes gene_type:complete
MKKYLIFIIFITNIFSQSLSSYSFNSSVSSSLAGAAVSNRLGIWSVYHNPALLVESENNSASIGYSNLYNQNFLPQSNFGLVLRTKKINLGIKFSNLSVKNQNIDLLKESLIGVSSGIYLLNDNNSSLSMGITSNLYMIDFGPSAGSLGDGSNGLDSDPISSLGIDLGFLGVLRDKNRLGVFIKNINSPTIGEGFSNQNLPRVFHIGLTTIPNNFMEVSFSAEQLLGYHSAQYRTALQYKLNRSFQLNTGVQINPNRFGIGFSYQKDSFNISYGYLTHHVLPGTHQFNFGIIF